MSSGPNLSEWRRKPDFREAPADKLLLLDLTACGPMFKKRLPPLLPAASTRTLLTTRRRPNGSKGAASQALLQETIIQRTASTTPATQPKSAVHATKGNELQVAGSPRPALVLRSDGEPEGPAWWTDLRGPR